MKVLVNPKMGVLTEQYPDRGHRPQVYRSFLQTENSQKLCGGMPPVHPPITPYILWDANFVVNKKQQSTEGRDLCTPRYGTYRHVKISIMLLIQYRKSDHGRSKK